MNLWRRLDILKVTRTLQLAYGALVEVESPKGTRKLIDLAELAALDTHSDELALLDGLLATAAEINRVAQVATRLVTITATGAITAAANDGKVNLLGEVGGNALVTLTLPAASGSGAKFRFVVSVRNTSNYVIKVASASDIMQGSIVGSADGGNTVNGWETAADSDTITLDGTGQGGYIGDSIELIDILPNVWSVAGQIVQTGSEATPFSAAV